MRAAGANPNTSKAPNACPVACPLAEHDVVPLWQQQAPGHEPGQEFIGRLGVDSTAATIGVEGEASLGAAASWLQAITGDDKTKTRLVRSTTAMRHRGMRDSQDSPPMSEFVSA